MFSIAGTISDVRQLMHGTASAKVLYRILGRTFPTPEKGSEPIVLFIGDSITQLWAIGNSELFKSNHFINAGIGGQTSGQIRKGCRLDIIRSHPDVVHLICGINDIAENQGPVSDHAILYNIRSVMKYCAARNIKIAVGSIMPATSVPWRPDLKPKDRIKSLNAKIEALCMRSAVLYIDYFSILRDESDDLRSEYAIDGLHLSRRGYRAIEPALLASLAQLRAQPRKDPSMVPT